MHYIEVQKLCLRNDCFHCAVTWAINFDAKTLIYFMKEMFFGVLIQKNEFLDPKNVKWHLFHYFIASNKDIQENH